jgi:hypothetical protein
MQLPSIYRAPIPLPITTTSENEEQHRHHCRVVGLARRPAAGSPIDARHRRTVQDTGKAVRRTSPPNRGDDLVRLILGGRGTPIGRVDQLVVATTAAKLRH